MSQLKTASEILKTAAHNFDSAADRLKLDSGLRQKLSQPKERIIITANPVMPDGKIRQFTAFVVRHSDALGPSKGGIRMTDDVTLDDVAGLAMEMSWKASLIGVPFGGGKAGICLDGGSLSKEEKEIIIRSFTRAAMRHIGPEIYIPAPDMGTNETDMGHIRDCISYSEGISITKGCYVTGKPVILGGITGRREATGKGVVYSILAACDKVGLDIKKARAAVQGFGNVGGVAAMETAGCGAAVVAVSDISGGVFNKNGLDIEQLGNHVKRTGYVKGFKNAAAIDRQEVLEVDCDIVIPAASQGQITAENAPKIKAKIIAEGANAPTTPAADEILNKRDVFVIPDILCNAGGVFVSYLEYTQETQREQMTLDHVNSRLNRAMNQRFEAVYDYGQKHNVTMRQAAMELAISRVAEGVVARGFLP
ncbi:MAG TPA: Glu/Leu/Phe/Val dehydrogenase [Sedimentisphaerales bacterium]|nr:Glu/Leu/Phe/Val dehydrogenase [Sedimentisphaerales bacterium]